MCQEYRGLRTGGSLEVQLAYAIGVSDPVSVCVDTEETGKFPDERLCAWSASSSRSRRAESSILDLRPPIFRTTASGGHFGRSEPEFTWEKTNRGAEWPKRKTAKRIVFMLTGERISGNLSNFGSTREPQPDNGRGSLVGLADNS